MVLPSTAEKQEEAVSFTVGFCAAENPGNSSKLLF
jgi:hypothetical protein